MNTVIVVRPGAPGRLAAALGDLPARMTACAKASDCCGVRGVCGGWVFVNAKYGAAAQEEYRRMAMAANCARSEETPAPAAACLAGRCGSGPGSGGACEQAFKLRAKAAVPALIKALQENEAYWTTYYQTKNDMLGYEDLAGPYLEALTAIGDAAAAVPAAAAMLGDERRGVQKERLLIFLRSQGPRAGAALPALLKLADLGVIAAPGTHGLPSRRGARRGDSPKMEASLTTRLLPALHGLARFPPL